MAFLVVRRCSFLPSRGAKTFKVKSQWSRASELGKKKTPAQFALEHFDFFYKPLFSKAWPSIRLGLLSDRKYAALVNSYADVGRISEELREQGAIDLLESVRKGRKRFRKGIDKAVPLVADGDAIDPFEQVSAKPRSVGEERLRDDARDESTLLEFVPVKPKERGVEDFLPEETRVGEAKSREEEFWQMRYNEVRAEVEIESVREESGDYPSNLRVFVFPSGDISVYPQSPPDRSGVSSYFLMDAASLLPVLALNLDEGDLVLDMCAAPGGKTLTMLQTLVPLKGIVCNEPDPSRLARLRQTLDTYLPDSAPIRDCIVLRHRDGTGAEGVEADKYDKVIVDAPCTTDRHALVDVEKTSLFRPSRSKERMQLPETQTKLLVNGIRSLKLGGSIVYSTCTLSPIQNDGVVQEALRRIFQTTGIRLVVKEMSELVHDVERTRLFRFARNPRAPRYGQLVVPYVVSNFGPMYFCKMQRVA